MRRLASSVINDKHFKEDKENTGSHQMNKTVKPLREKPLLAKAPHQFKTKAKTTGISVRQSVGSDQQSMMDKSLLLSEKIKYRLALNRENQTQYDPKDRSRLQFDASSGGMKSVV